MTALRAAAPAATLLPSLAVALCGAVWGLFWLPVRYMEAEGLPGAWPSVAFFAVTVALLAPFALRRAAGLVGAWRELCVTGIATGGAFALYLVALPLTDVVDVILLFYLTPLWSTLLGRWLLGLRITPMRGAVLICGFAGLWVVLGGDGGLPVPRSLGDWLALLAGLAWAFGSLRLYRGSRSDRMHLVFAFVTGGGLVSLAALLLLPVAAMPAAGLPGSTAAWLAAVLLALVIMPTNFLIIWAASRLDPGRVGILMMLEVLVGVGSAAWLGDEPFAMQQAIGTLLVLLAGVLEVLQRPAAAGSR